MLKNYLFIINPIAGDGNRLIFKKAFNHWQAQTKHLFEIYETTGQNDAENIEALVAKNKFSLLAAVGGDGTLLLAAKIARVQKCKLAFFPQGSANGMATELALPADPAQQFKLLKSPKFRAVDMLLFNKKYWSLHISDIGLNAAMVKEYAAIDTRGFLGYGKGLLKALAHFEAFEVAVQHDGKTTYHSCLMVAFGNARKYGTGASLNSVGKLDDGKFELCLIHKLRPGQLAQHYFDLKAEDSENLTLLQCEKVRLKTSRAQPFQVDGEPLGELRELDVEIYQQVLEIVVP